MYFLALQSLLTFLVYLVPFIHSCVNFFSSIATESEGHGLVGTRLYTDMDKSLRV